MKPILFTLSFLLLSGMLFAQQPTDSTTVASDSVSTKIDSLANEATIVVTEALKDSLQAQLPVLDTAGVKEEIKSTAKQAITDSLNNHVEVPNIALDSTLMDQLKGEAKKIVSEELGATIPKIDSTTVKNEVKFLVKEQLENQVGVIPEVNLDSTLIEQGSEEIEKRAERFVENNSEQNSMGGLDEQLGEVSEIKDQLEEVQQAIKEKVARKELREKMTRHAKTYIEKNAEKIQQIQSQMGELKQVYSSVPNSNDLSTAKKRGSLKGESVWKRLVLGGNFNMSKTNPIAIDLSPVLGWKFNKVCEAGISGAYRAKLGADRAGVNAFESDEVYGYSAFANYMVFKNFFAYLEGENMSKVTGTVEYHERKWHPSLLVGIGRKFNIAKFLEMQAIVSYNFLHNNTDNLYNSPVVFKTGFRIKK